MKQICRRSFFLLLLGVALLPDAVYAAPEHIRSFEQLGRSLLRALANRSFADLQALTPPTPAVWRSLASGETGHLDDSQIAAKLAEHYYPKLRRDFDNIIESASRSGVDLSKLEFLDVKSDTADSGAVLVGLEIRYSYLGTTGKIAVSAARMDGHYYLHEILLSYDIFERRSGE